MPFEPLFVTQSFEFAMALCIKTDNIYIISTTPTCILLLFIKYIYLQPLWPTLKTICAWCPPLYYRYMDDGFREKYHVKMDLHKSTPSGFSKTFTRICTYTHTRLPMVLSLIYVCVFLSIDANPRYVSVCIYILWIKYLCTVSTHVQEVYLK